MITSIVFDCFGVLYEDAFKNIVETHINEHSSHPRQYYYDLALASDRGLISDQQLYAELAKISGQDPQTIRHHLRDVSVLNQPLIDLIVKLSPHYQIALLSNAERSFLDHFLNTNQIAELFPVIVASSETPYIKPQKEIFQEVARRLGTSFDQILFIDDSPTNTQAAMSFGIASITYQNTAQLQAELKKHQISI